MSLGRGITGFRILTWLLLCFLAMGMVNYLESATGYFNYREEPKYNITDIADMQGIQVGSENTSSSDIIEPVAQPEEASGYQFLDSFIYGYKLATFLAFTLRDVSIGLHTYLYNAFGIGLLPWGLPIAIIIGLSVTYGLYQVFTKTEV